MRFLEHLHNLQEQNQIFYKKVQLMVKIQKKLILEQNKDKNIKIL